MPYRYPRKTKYKLQVKRSSAGLGLFATEKIKRKDFIIEYFGPLITDEELGNREGKYLFEVEDELSIDGKDRKNTARYINHSCKPNCEPEIDGKRVFIYSLRTIYPGEELTYDYGKEYFDGFIKPYGCKCGHHRKRRT